jgi:hypothetical protein
MFGGFCASEPVLCDLAPMFLLAGGVALAFALSDRNNNRNFLSNLSDHHDHHYISDARLKRDVKHIHTLENGIKLYAFRYFGDERGFVGVLAQDLLKDNRFAHAVATSSDGYYSVNYAALRLPLHNGHVMATSGSNALKAARGASVTN